ncbi:uncharacterized protein [Typha latifolia]|uniref:uncharacterized protein n=1 Tax=Typha latifolia TaxID=4733 RepID=UPI003C2E1B61
MDTSSETSSSSKGPRMPKQLNEICNLQKLQDQYRETPVNLVCALRNGKSVTQHDLSPQNCRLQLCGKHVNAVPTSTMSSARPLHNVALADRPGVNLTITNLDAEKGFYNFQMNNQLDKSNLFPNPLGELLNHSSSTDISASWANALVPVQSSNNTEIASSFQMTLHHVEKNKLIEAYTAPAAGYIMSVTEAESSTSMSNDGVNEILPENHALTKRKSGEDIFNPAKTISKVMVCSEEGRIQSCARKRLSRARISEGIKALQSSLQCPEKSNKEAVLDEVIDYIKFLKLKLKALSQNRLIDEANGYPFVHFEGYGHYLLHPQMSDEPLEEMMGQLMDSNMQAANELFESKGLAILPMELAYSLLLTN